METCTPVKFESLQCFICKSSSHKYYLLQNKVSLRELILKYLVLNVVTGRLCESCQNKINTIERKCTELKQLYNEENKAGRRSKRLFNSPAKQGKPTKLHHTDETDESVSNIVYLDETTLESCLDYVDDAITLPCIKCDKPEASDLYNICESDGNESGLASLPFTGIIFQH